MALLPLLRALRDLEETIAIEDPVEISNPTAYLIVPDRDETLATQPAVFENYPEPAGDMERIGTYREDIETVRVRFTAYDADYDRACEIAVAFYDAFKNAIDGQRPAGQRLGGTFDHLSIRADQNPLSSFEGRPGFELLLDFQVFVTVPV